jgi:hypothetical protein
MGAPTIEDRTLACGSTRGTTVCVTGNSHLGVSCFTKPISLSLSRREAGRTGQRRHGRSEIAAVCSGSIPVDRNIELLAKQILEE